MANAKSSELSGLMLCTIVSIIASETMKSTLGFRMLQFLPVSVTKENPSNYYVPLQTLEVRAQSDSEVAKGDRHMIEFNYRASALSHLFLRKQAQPSKIPIERSQLNAELAKDSTGPSAKVLLGGSEQQNETNQPQENNGHHINRRLLIVDILLPAVIGGLLICGFIGWTCHHFSLLQSFAARIGSQPYPDPDPNLSSANENKGSSLVTQWRRTDAGSGAKQGISHRLDYATLKEATQNFSSANLLGEGGSGSVYKAKLTDNFYVAVKKLFANGPQADRDVQAEIELMERVHHPNLLSLIGFCSHEEQGLLVYELMQNGSLYGHLQGPSQGSALSWNLRLKIALDAAKGLEHLHDHCNPAVIHRDIKSSNLLLDENFNAKLSDFGLALSTPGVMKKGESIQLQGTLGYVAPEYILNGVLTDKSDVYAYGVVLLELITGRKPIDTSMPTGLESLVSWATPYLTDRKKLPTIVAPVLEQTLNLKQLFQLAAVAVLCVQPEPGYRPLIGDVVNSLIPLVPVELGGTSRVQNTPPLAVQ